MDHMPNVDPEMAAAVAEGLRLNEARRNRTALIILLVIGGIAFALFVLQMRPDGRQKQDLRYVQPGR